MLDYGCPDPAPTDSARPEASFFSFALLLAHFLAKRDTASQKKFRRRARWAPVSTAGARHVLAAQSPYYRAIPVVFVHPGRERWRGVRLGSQAPGGDPSSLGERLWPLTTADQDGPDYPREIPKYKTESTTDHQIPTIRNPG